MKGRKITNIDSFNVDGIYKITYPYGDYEIVIQVSRKWCRGYNNDRRDIEVVAIILLSSNDVLIVGKIIQMYESTLKSMSLRDVTITEL